MPRQYNDSYAVVACAKVSWWRNQMETFSALLALVRGIHRSPVNSPHKGQWRGSFMFSLISAWTKGWANNWDMGDLRCHRANYDVNVVCSGHFVRSAMGAKWSAHQILIAMEKSLVKWTFVLWSHVYVDWMIWFRAYHCVIDNATQNGFKIYSWKYFPRYWSPVDSPHKGHWRGDMMFSLISAWTNGRANNRDAGDLRHHRAHYDVTVMPSVKQRIAVDEGCHIPIKWGYRMGQWHACRWCVDSNGRWRYTGVLGRTLFSRIYPAFPLSGFPPSARLDVLSLMFKC